MQAAGVMDKIKGAVSNVAKNIETGNKETEGLGSELAARAQMNRAASGALEGDKPSDATPAKGTAAKPAPIDKVNKGREYGDAEGAKRGEKKIDTTDMTKPLGSFAKGTDSVPKTGVYKIHEGEAVVSNKDKKMSGEHTPKEKAHFHRAMSHLHGGALHRHFGIPEDQPIPMEKKQEAANSENPHVAAMGRLAVAMHGWGHKK
jgi:hypothetical protein